MISNGEPEPEWGGLGQDIAPPESAAFPASPPPSTQEAHPASLPPPAMPSRQQCAFRHRNQAHAYFETMEPDTDTDSDDAYIDDDEEYQLLIDR
eukprot:9617693-Prorocentrum_lima.AAC.1